MEETVYKEYQALITGEYKESVFANTSAFVNEHLHGCNWVGFYFMVDGELKLGPFQGKVACYRIKVGKGVCGTAVAQRKAQLVPDVHKFPGHIACDSSTNSEIVVPIIVKDEVVGVLDLDSQEFDHFHEEEKNFLERIVEILIQEVY